ncbi:hypothetical protein M0804_007384 [Polistes exclamans]|nr:hypothetical protein M0804_007384 [Polistes exclamans]
MSIIKIQNIKDDEEEEDEEEEENQFITKRKGLDKYERVIPHPAGYGWDERGRGGREGGDGVSGDGGGGGGIASSGR